jgi:hypothetical protein
VAEASVSVQQTIALNHRVRRYQEVRDDTVAPAPAGPVFTPHNARLNGGFTGHREEVDAELFHCVHQFFARWKHSREFGPNDIARDQPPFPHTLSHGLRGR